MYNNTLDFHPVFKPSSLFTEGQTCRFKYSLKSESSNCETDLPLADQSFLSLAADGTITYLPNITAGRPAVFFCVVVDNGLSSY
jgi:hypothetical protein